MTVYVKDTQFPIEANVNPYNAALGFYLRGEEVIHYREQKEIGTFNIDDILVDYVTETQAFLAAMGIQVPHFDYPTALQPYSAEMCTKPNWKTSSIIRVLGASSSSRFLRRNGLPAG